jgi:DNA polymerase-1
MLAPKRYRKTVVTEGKRKPKQVTKWVYGEPCSLWQSMVDHAVKGGMTEDELIVQAQVARILRSGDFDNETRTVRLWRPGGAYSEMTL